MTLLHHLKNYFTFLNSTPGSKYYNLKINPLVVVLFFISIFISSFILLHSAFLILLLMMMLSMIPLLNLIPSTWFMYTFTYYFLDAILQFFSSTGLLKFFYLIYVFWHQCLTFRGYKLFYTLLHILLIFYLLIIRYMFYLKINNVPIPWSSYLLYFCFLFVFIIKILSETSFFLIKLICIKFPYYKELLLTELPEELPPGTNPKTGLHHNYNSKTSWSIFNIYSNKHRHIYPPEIPQSKFTFYAKIGFTTIGLGLSVWAGYNYHRSADAAVRAADATEVQAGLMTKEEFYKKHRK